ncbi:MAG: cell division protein ZapB [Gemmatimonadota bacterium]|nr:MAG: cell division protein ZapB [Gemmatimonadota bacterium]
MEFQSLEQLEERVSKAVELMTTFREENQELQNQNRELLAKLEEYERNLQKLRIENEELRETQKKNELSNAHQEEIRKKVEGMLSKLDSV